MLKTNLLSHKYAVSIGLVTLATGLTWLAWPHNQGSPYALYHLAAVLSSFYGGWRAGALATFFGALIGDYLFIPPFYSWQMLNTIEGSVHVIVFAAVSSLMVGLVESLQRTQERLRHVLEETYTGVWDWDIASGKVFWTPQHFTMLGYEPDSVEPSFAHWAARVHPDDLARTEAAVRDAMEQHREYCHQFRTLWPNGIIRWIEAHGTYTYRSNGQCTRMIGLMRDITESKQAEVALHESEERLSHAVRLTKCGLFDHNHQTGTLYWSPRIREIYGVSSEEPASLDGYIQLLHPDDRDAIVASIKRAHDPAGDGLLEVDHRLLRGDGTVRWVSLQSRTQFESHGSAIKLIRTIGAIIDITERKQAEKLLEQQVSAIIDGGMQERLVFDEGKDFGNLAAILNKLFDRIEVVPKMDSKQTENQWVKGNFKPVSKVTDWHPQFQEALFVLSRKLIETQEAERRHIARELHDEIGQMMTALKINLQSLEISSGEAIPRLHDNLQLIERVLTQVRSLSLDLRPPLLDDLGLISALRWFLDQQAQHTGLKVRFNARHNFPRLTPELEISCYRIVQEAVNNTYRHAEAKNVWVDLAQIPDHIVLTVGDDGKGFDVEEKFKDSLKGNSMGLLSMKERALLMDGEVMIESLPGEGSLVKAFFPYTPGMRNMNDTDSNIAG